MAVYLRGETYWVEFVWNGERVRFSAKTSNKAEARQIEAAEKTNRAMGRAGITQRDDVPTLGVFLAGKFTNHYTLHVKPNTARSYAYGVRVIGQYKLGSRRLDEITNEHVTAMASQMRADGLAVATINTVIKVIRRALSLASEWEISSKRPRLSLVPGEHQRELVLTDEQIETYLAACSSGRERGGAWAVMATMLAFSGMRPNEARVLRWENVNLAGRTLQITGGKTKNARRELPILARSYDVLVAHWERAGKPETGYVFESRVKPGEPLSDYGSQHRDVCKRSGIAVFVPYTFRHSFLTKLGNSNVDTFTLMKIAGHATPSITARYVHPQRDAIRRAFDGVDTPKTPHIVPPPKKHAA